jgi:hypothetical protein
MFVNPDYFEVVACGTCSADVFNAAAGTDGRTDGRTTILAWLSAQNTPIHALSKSCTLAVLLR